jgi:hypothetical protein
MANAKPVKKSKAKKPSTRAKGIKSKERVNTKSKNAKATASRTKSKKSSVTTSKFEKMLPKNVNKFKADMKSALGKFEKNELVQKVEDILEKFEIYLLTEGGRIANKGVRLAKKAKKLAKEKMKKKSVKKKASKKKSLRKAKK